jgi:hypothetical protein
MIRKTILAAALAAIPFAAAPSLTTIQDVLYKADGTRFNGTLTISWTSFVTADSSSIVTQSTTVKVLDGNLRVQLAPTTTSTPPITYSVVYNSDGKVQFQEIWAVPVSATPLLVRDVRVAGDTSGAGGGGSTGSLGADTGSVSESQVTGLLADLGTRTVKGPGFTAGRAAVIDSSGAVESALGTLSDCVHVDGSSGPCGGGAPAFIDGEVPAGIVDGSNGTFTLSAIPNPVGSVSVYRNGILMKTGFDYLLTGNTVQFVAGAIPQGGDTMLVSYRTDGSGSGPAPVYSIPQVLCSGAGTSSNSTTLATLGTCTIPAGLLAAGDRVEIRYDYAHIGSNAGFSVEVHWGATTVLHRDSVTSETMLTGRTDSSMLNSGSQLSSQTWGATGGIVTNAGSAPDVFANGVKVTLLGLVAAPSDAVSMSNFVVMRIP